MTAHLPSRLTQFLFIAILSLVLPETMLAGPGGAGPGGGHGGGGGHSGGGHSASGHGGHVVGAVGGHTSGAPVSGSRGSAAHGNNGAYNGGAEHSEANISGGHSGVFTAPDGNFGRDSATEASLAQMAGHGWNFLPSSGVRPAAQPSRTTAFPARAANFASHPAFFPGRPYGHGPYIYGIFPYGSLYGVPGFGFGLAGNCFNGFTSFCGPAGYGFYGGPCARYGYPFCGPGWGWGGVGFVGYAPYGDQEFAPNDINAQTNDSYDNGQGADTGGNYSDMPPEIPPVADASPGAASSQVAVTPPSVPAQLIFKGGSAYAVTSYWVSGTELYYRPVYGGTNHVPLDQLDLPATVEANTRAGVPFTLSARPPQN